MEKATKGASCKKTPMNYSPINYATPNSLGSIICYTDTGTKVKIVVVKHNSKKNEYNRILSKDT